MEPGSAGDRIFSLCEAQQLLPEVKALTADAVRRVEALTSRLRAVAEVDPAHAELNTQIADVVRGWAQAVQSAGLETKGLWLVDFDNGEGYYCWCYPEARISHFHDYNGGFSGRVKIV